MSEIDMIDSYLSSPDAPQDLIGIIRAAAGALRTQRVTKENIYIEIGSWGIWKTVKIGSVDEDSGDFDIAANAYYRIINESCVATDLGEAMRNMRRETGFCLSLRELQASRLGELISRKVNQGTTADPPVIDFEDSVVQTRRSVSRHYLALAICRVLLGNLRLSHMRIDP